MQPKTVLVTGGNTGLGLEIVRALYKSSQAYHIYLTGRDQVKVEGAIGELLSNEDTSTVSTLEGFQLDVEDDNSIMLAFRIVEKKFGHLDILVNNAGASFDQELQAGEIAPRQAWNKSWSVNTTSPQIMTSTFVPLLLKSAEPRIIFITSGTSTLTGQEAEKLGLDQAPASGWPKSAINWSSYRSAKTGMNMMMREWARLLKNDGVRTFAVSPGLLITGLGGDKEALKRMGAVEPRLGAELVCAVIEGERDADAGRVINRAGIQDW